MAYMTIFVKDLVELKTRRGTATTAVLARVVGLNYPPTDAEVYYEWDNASIAVGDDYNIVHPTTGGTLPGRWFKRKIEELDPTVPQHVKDISQGDIDYWDGKQDPITAGEGLTKTGVTLAVDNAEVVRSNRELTINGLTQNLSANRTWTVGDILSTGSYSNPSWITSLAANKIPGLAPVATSGSYPDLINKPTIPTTTSDLINNSNFIVGNGLITEYVRGDGSKATFPSISASQIQSDWNQSNNTSVDFIKNKPTIPTNTNQLTNDSGFITANSNDTLTNKNGNISQWTNNSGYLTEITSGQVTTALGFTPISQIGARTAISLTTTGTSGTATYNSTTGVLNIPNYTTSASTVNNTAVKTINGAGVQISTTKNTRVSYTITHTIALTLVLSSGSSMVFLEISPNNTTWTSISQAGFSDAVAVAVALNKTSTNNVQGEVPAGWYVRLRAVTSGAGSAAYTVGQEVQY